MVKTKYLLLAALFGVVVCLPAHAQSIKNIVNQSRDIMNTPEATVGDAEIATNKRASEIRQNLLDGIQNSTTIQMARGTEMLKGTQFEPKAPQKVTQQAAAFDENGLRYEIFASRSLQAEGLKQVFSLAAKHPSSVVVFQGLQEGQKIGEGIKELHKLIRGLDPVPNVIIDPKRFRDQNIKNVPAVIAYDRNNGVISSVHGTANPEFISNELRRDVKGDLGIVGTVYEISEPNLIDVMRSKVLEIDWKAKIAGAQQRYLKNLEFVTLPIADVSKTIRVKPINRLTKDIKIPNSEMVYPAGLQFNPLKYHSFRTFIVIFDATDPEQLQYAGRLADAQSEHRPVSLITTKINRKDGFKWLGKKEQEIGYPIYLLKKDFAKTLFVQAVPSTIEADGEDLVITTFAREDWE